MHREEQTMLKSPEQTKDMGLDLALEVRVFRDDEEEPEVLMNSLLLATLCRCCSR